MDIIRVKGNTYCADIHGTCTGLYMAGKNQVILIDSGRYPSEELFTWLEKEALKPCAVIHTHLHIDHIANSRKLEELYGSNLFAAEEEPSEEYVDFSAKTNPKDQMHLCSATFNMIPTPGHSPGHQMIITPDNVGFCGDAVLTEDFLGHVMIPYMDFPMASVKSMHKIKRLSLDFMVCSHNGIVCKSEINRVIDLNIQKEFDLFELLEETVSRPILRQELIDLFMRNVGIWDSRIRQYGYMTDTVSFRIDELIKENRLKEIDDVIFPV